MADEGDANDMVCWNPIIDAVRKSFEEAASNSGSDLLESQRIRRDQSHCRINFRKEFGIKSCATISVLFCSFHDVTLRLQDDLQIHCSDSRICRIASS